ncbi:hypothetical protein ASF99_08515 [Exiguobacterium sp. Leaf187]|uniref:Repressor Rok winged helix domain-containing protein n=2 Tax=Bacillales Family XII. Incertae Sedis TaxID=539742 RepID=A0A0V8GIJ9_9BACL|nr:MULTISPECIES: hypothetical protein [Exiguobacterium]AHA30679.1 hypothetical protein U719_13640 [Exiguobacterium sp. MH3]KSU50080.1 hypothetical protein AS033_01525 [Exiguobacterium enclense]KOP30206.1 hypothetical protein ADM98_15355 [Exiguobacterium sp. BMC-KP]KQS19917.1 hypothetical protein ASF99_08515 [Exiguobacterium sp. Leaf187]KTR27500.1 hypothetical protein RSA11_05825 [Exiguobacterium indicum]
MDPNEHIYRELMEIEEEYRRLQRRAEYLVAELSRTNQDHAQEVSVALERPLKQRRVNQRYPLEVYVHQISDLMRERESMSARDIQMELELRYRHQISNIYQLMAKVEQANPAIQKVGRGIYTYDSSAEVPIFM